MHYARVALVDEDETGSYQQHADHIAQTVDETIEQIRKENEDEIKSILGLLPSASHTPVEGCTTSKTRDEVKTDRRFDDVQLHTAGKEVKLSHERHDEEVENFLKDELMSKFVAIKVQMNEYQQRYMDLREKSYKSRSRLAEIEVKCDELEQENETLKDELHLLSMEVKEGSTTGHEPISPTKVSNRMRSVKVGRDMQYREIQLKNEELLRSLLFTDSLRQADTTLLSIDSVFASKSFFGFLCASATYLSRLISSILPFERDISVLQARYGASIASYFTFGRFIFLHLLLIAMIMLIFTVFHVVTMKLRGVSDYDTVFGSPNMPFFMTFSSFDPSEKRFYSGAVMLTALLSIVLLMVKILEEDKGSKVRDAFDRHSEHPVGQEVLGSWDNHLSSRLEIETLQADITNRLIHKLEEARRVGVLKNRSTYDFIFLTMRRIGGFFLYVLLLSSSSALIVYITLRTNHWKKASSSSIYSSISFVIPPFLLSTINAFIPLLVACITELEQWDSGTRILNIVLLRVYLSSTLNSLILAFTFLLVADPYSLASLRTIRGALTQTTSSSECNFDVTCNGLASLVFITWLNRLFFFVSPYASMFYAYLRSRPFEKGEFDVPNEMVKKFSMLGLVFMLIPFAPLAMTLVPIGLYIDLKWQVFFTKRLYTKPKRPWKAQKASLIFSAFYSFTYAILGISSLIFFFSTKTFPKDCAIQDAHARLCVADTYDSNTQTCQQNEDSKYHYIFRSDPYPYVVCHGLKSCGAFVHESSAMIPLYDARDSLGAISWIWNLLLAYPYIPWTLVILLVIAVGLLHNSSTVTAQSSEAKIRELNLHIFSMSTEVKRQEAIIHKLKSIDLSAE